MSAGMWEQDFPATRHDARCTTWLGTDVCDCRDVQGHAPALSTAERLELLVPTTELACDIDLGDTA